MKSPLFGLFTLSLQTYDGDKLLMITTILLFYLYIQVWIFPYIQFYMANRTRTDVLESKVNYTD